MFFFCLKIEQLLQYSRVFPELVELSEKRYGKAMFKLVYFVLGNMVIFQSVVIVHGRVYFFLGILPSLKLTYYPLKIGHPSRNFHLRAIHFQGPCLFWGGQLFFPLNASWSTNWEAVLSIIEGTRWLVNDTIHELTLMRHFEKKHKESIYSVLAMVQGLWILFSGKVIMQNHVYRIEMMDICPLVICIFREFPTNRFRTIDLRFPQRDSYTRSNVFFLLGIHNMTKSSKCS